MRVEERTVTVWDGTELFYRAWLPEGKADKALVLFHRGHEHSGRLTELAEKLCLDGCAAFAWDARGNGRSPGPRDYADSFGVYAKDANCFVQHLAEIFDIPLENMAVVGNSVGAAIVATWVHDYAPPIRAMVLAAPAFRIKLYVPFAIPMLRLALKLGVMKTVTSYVKSKVLTHDPEQQRQFDEDPLISHSISTNILLDLHDTATRVVQNAGAIRTPTLLLMSGADWVVKTGVQRRFFDNLSAADKQLQLYPRFYHAIFFEQDRAEPIRLAREFLLRQFAQPARRLPLVDADRDGFSKREYDRLQQPRFSPVALVSRVTMRTIGRLSKGVDLGWRTGFDSGVTLDYVYQNRPQGRTLLGRWIDRLYLGSPGWSGIRQRKINLERLLREAIRRVHAAGDPVHIVDVAAGPGRHILETIKATPEIRISAALRDYQKVNLDEGKRLAAKLDVETATYEQGSAFDRTALARLSPSPTIAVVSGLFELFPSNDGPREALAGLADAVAPGGYLIYTNQPWHPQLEFIARVLMNREGEPWVMRCRTQEEMDDLVHEAGFGKIDMEIDRWGIFTVSLARRMEG